MIKIRKKLTLDGIDREILRVLTKRSSLVTRNIAKVVGLSPPAITPRLNNLKNSGIIKISKVSEIRSYQRFYGKNKVQIKSPSSVHWSLDIIHE